MRLFAGFTEPDFFVGYYFEAVQSFLHIWGSPQGHMGKPGTMCSLFILKTCIRNQHWTNRKNWKNFSTQRNQVKKKFSTQSKHLGKTQNTVIL